MKKIFASILYCCFSVGLCYSQNDTHNETGQAVTAGTNPKKDSLTKLNLILFDSVMVAMYGQTRSRINSLEQLGIYLDHSSIQFDSTNVIIVTTQMTDMKFYNPLRDFLRRYKFHDIIHKPLILQDPAPAK